MKNELNIEEVIDKLKVAINVKTNVALANYMNINQSTISKWIQNKTLDFKKIIEKFPNISLDWLVYGIGEPYITSEENIESMSEREKFDKIHVKLDKIEIMLEDIRRYK